MILLAVVFVVLAVSYVAAAPDQRTHAVSRGLLGAVQAGAAAGDQAIGRVRSASGTTVTGAKSGKRSGSRTKTTPEVRPSFLRDVAAVFGWFRSGAKWSAAFVAAVPEAYRTAADQAEQDREDRRTRRAERQEKRKTRREEQRQKKVAKKAAKDLDEKYEELVEEGATEWPYKDGTDAGANELDNSRMKENTVTQLAGEYTAPGDITSDLDALKTLCELEIETIRRRNEQLAQMRAKYEAADLTTDNLDGSFNGLVEAVGPEGILESIPAVESAVTEAETLGEHVSTVGADSHTSSFQPN